VQGETMNRKDFDKLNGDQRDLVLDEIIDLYNLIENYPVNFNSLLIFTKWVSVLGMFDEELEDFLTGIYPYYKMESGKYDIEKLYYLSTYALNFINTSHKYVKSEYLKGL
jgi:hypothetical protein